MELDKLKRGLALIEEAVAELDPALVPAEQARTALALCARVERLGAYGVTTVSRKISDPEVVAKASGTSVGKAKAIVATGETMSSSEHLADAFRTGQVSLDQAAVIAATERSAPGSAQELVEAAGREGFHALRDRARRIKLDAEQHRGLAERQRTARRARSYSDELGMLHLDLVFQPHIGGPLLARAEADAQRLSRLHKGEDKEPFERYLADAFAAMLQRNGKGRSRRPELVVVVSHEVATRGWKDVRPGEVCKIPGLGPVAPQTAKAIAQDAFINGVVSDGKDLRHFKRWGRHIPVEVQIALELGAPPEFDGIKCSECGKRFRPEFDHLDPCHLGGATSWKNLAPKCPGCHAAKSERERIARMAERRRSSAVPVAMSESRRMVIALRPAAGLALQPDAACSRATDQLRRTGLAKPSDNKHFDNGLEPG